MNQVTRNGMTCESCGRFSSSPRCFSCTNSYVGLALICAEVRIAELEGDLSKYREAVEEIRALEIPHKSKCIGITHTFSLWAGVWGQMSKILCNVSKGE